MQHVVPRLALPPLIPAVCLKHLLCPIHPLGGGPGTKVVENDTTARKITEFWVPKPKDSKVPVNFEKPEPEAAKTGSSPCKLGSLQTRTSGNSRKQAGAELSQAQDS